MKNLELKTNTSKADKALKEVLSKKSFAELLDLSLSASEERFNCKMKNDSFGLFAAENVSRVIDEIISERQDQKRRETKETFRLLNKVFDEYERELNSLKNSLR